MSNVDKVKLLSERTSGVPLVIFDFEDTPIDREGISQDKKREC